MRLLILMMMSLNVSTYPPARFPAPAGAVRQPGAPRYSPLPANCQSEPGDTEPRSDNGGEGETHLDILPRPSDHLSKQLGVVCVQGRLASLAPFMKHEETSITISRAHLTRERAVRFVGGCRCCYRGCQLAKKFD